MTTPSSPKPLLSTADYDLVVTTDKDDMSAYGLLNRETGVMEAIGPHLPSAMMSLYQLQETLNQVRKDPEAAAREELRKREQILANPFGLADDEDPGFRFN